MVVFVRLGGRRIFHHESFVFLISEQRRNIFDLSKCLNQVRKRINNFRNTLIYHHASKSTILFHWSFLNNTGGLRSTLRGSCRGLGTVDPLGVVGQMDRWTEGWMDKILDKERDRRTDGRGSQELGCSMDRQRHKWMNEQKNVRDAHRGIFPHFLPTTIN